MAILKIGRCLAPALAIGMFSCTRWDTFEVRERFTEFLVTDANTKSPIEGAVILARAEATRGVVFPIDPIPCAPTDQQGRVLIPAQSVAGTHPIWGNVVQDDWIWHLVIDSGAQREELAVDNREDSTRTGTVFGVTVVEVDAEVGSNEPIRVENGSNPPRIVVGGYTASLRVCANGRESWRIDAADGTPFVQAVTLGEVPQGFVEATVLEPCNIPGLPEDRASLVQVTWAGRATDAIAFFCEEPDGGAAECAVAPP